VKHLCDYTDHVNKRNYTRTTLEHQKHLYGPAVTKCKEFDGMFLVDNDEYASQVNYCPFCGAKAPIQVEYDENYKESWED